MSQNQGSNSSANAWIAGCLGAAGVVVAAIIALGAPIAQRAADYYFPVLTPIPNIQPTFSSSPLDSPTQTTIITETSPQQSFQQPSTACQEAGGASGFSLSQTPSAPTDGCVLIIEWWVPPDANNCGIIITTREPIIPKNSAGAWWYVYSQRPDSHKQEFLAKNPHCKVEDLR